MDETVDVQAVAIGAGTAVAVGLLAYGTLVGESILGVDTTSLATGAFAATFLAVAALHGAYGRRDLAAAHGAAGVGLALVALAASGFQVLGGYLLLVVGGAYIAVVTVRARDEEREVAG
ncbi:hypothetical protein [Natronococcus wangiae]|uniref:hypothetical protein n=1 Tax=Natronococcus wangiae TaxID=3068275 RepID=UPI00273F418F|nr:hypothetical protein [Natronococcus sp. AD5]